MMNNENPNYKIYTYFAKQGDQIITHDAFFFTYNIVCMQETSNYTLNSIVSHLQQPKCTRYFGVL